MKTIGDLLSRDLEPQDRGDHPGRSGRRARRSTPRSPSTSPPTASGTSTPTSSRRSPRPRRPARGRSASGSRASSARARARSPRTSATPSRTARSWATPSPTLFKQQIDDKRVGDLLDLDQRPVPHRGHPLRGRQGAGHPQGHRADRRVDVHGPAPGARLRRGLRHRRAGDRAGGRGQARPVRRDLQAEVQHRLADGPQGRAEALPGQRHPPRLSTRRRTRPTDSWAHAQRNRDAAITVSKVVERTFELMGRRRPGKALVFIIDEVGQHVARSGDKIEDLRATVEEFGKVGKNLLKEKKIIAPCWIVVTSQEKLDEVVAAIDSKRVELAKLQDRFRHSGRSRPLRHPRGRHQAGPGEEGRGGPDPRDAVRREPGHAQRRPAAGADDPPHRDRRGRFRPVLPLPAALRRPLHRDHVGHPAPARRAAALRRQQPDDHQASLRDARLRADGLARQPIGTLVTLDKVFELVEGNLSNEKRTDIHDIGQRFKDDAEDGGWSLRVAKVICLLEFLRDLPRTEANIAAFLVDRGGPARPARAGAGGGASG